MRWIGAVIAVALLAFSGCASQMTSATNVSEPKVTSPIASTTTTASLGDATLQALAQIAQTQSMMWSEPHPSDVRVALSSQSEAESISVSFAVGESSPRFVIAMDGRFICEPPSCATSGGGPNPNPVTDTTTTSQPTVMTMILTVDPSTLTADPFVAVRYQDVDMNEVGKVYNLDPYLNQ